MRHSKTEPLSEIVSSYLKEFGIEKKINETRLVNSWAEIVGKVIARSTTSINIRDGVLEIQIRSSVIKNELLMLKEGLIKALNEKVGEKIIHDIKIR